MDERDPKTPADENERTTSDADVEAHKYAPPGRTVHDRRTPMEGDEGGDETPDVEGHRLVNPKIVPTKTVSD
jgi:hypothetical protein